MNPSRVRALIATILFLLFVLFLTRVAAQDNRVTVPKGSHWGLEKDPAQEVFRIPAKGLYVCLNPVYTTLEKPIKFTVAPYMTSSPNPEDPCVPVDQQAVDKLNAKIKAIQAQQAK